MLLVKKCALTPLVVLLFREAGKTTRVSVRSQMKGDMDEYFSESSSESEEEEESQDRRQVSLCILEGEGYSPKFLVGIWGAFLETLNLLPFFSMILQDNKANL